MDRDAKRKATGPPYTPGDTPRGAKRQKVPGMDQSEETVETTKELGEQFLQSLYNAKDKTGRPIATPFLTLLDPSHPEYNDQIKLPIALDTIENKLRAGLYPNLSAVESDCKRMVTNAKNTYPKDHPVYLDAERVRKTASNFMCKYNPAYRDPLYVAVATPIPGEEGTNSPALPLTTSARRPSSTALAQMSKVQNTKAESAAPSPAPVISDGNRFVGKTLQQAQEYIIDELIHFTEDDLEIFTPFQNLPSRQLTDYYQVIKHPVSLKSVAKLVRGVHGRNPPTGVSQFSTWDEFVAEVSLIWKNAKAYNEDGSDMFNLAGELEEVFNEYLEEAKEAIPSPPSTTLKLKIGAEPKQSLRLKFAPPRDSPAGTPGPSTPATTSLDRSTPGVRVHSEALERQQQLVSAGVNGNRPKSTNGANPFSAARQASTPIPAIPPHLSRSASAASPPRQMNGVKDEANSQAVAAPSTKRYPHYRSAFEQANTVASTTIPTSFDGPPSGFHLPNDSKRPEDQSIKDYLMPSVHFQSHPAANLEEPFSVTYGASRAKVYNSWTFYVNPKDTPLIVTPHIQCANTSDIYRVIVQLNSVVLGPIRGDTYDRVRPQYELRNMIPGMANRVEIDVIASSKYDQTVTLWEKMACYVFLRRNNQD